jgi:hypothetical protein
MTSRLRLLGAAAAAACALLLTTARCSSTDGGDDAGSCVPLDGTCGADACCSISTRGDPLTCDADAGKCAIRCLSARRDCTGTPDLCCPGYSCQPDSTGYSICK